MFSSKLSEQDVEMHTDDEHLSSAALHLCDTLYNCASASKSRGTPVEAVIGNGQGRWDRIIGDNDQAKLWQAIHWRGEITDESRNVDCKSTDEVFKDNLEQISKPPDVENLDIHELFTDVTISVLDEPISPDEVANQIRRLICN